MKSSLFILVVQGRDAGYYIGDDDDDDNHNDDVDQENTEDLHHPFGNDDSIIIKNNHASWGQRLWSYDGIYNYKYDVRWYKDRVF